MKNHQCKYNENWEKEIEESNVSGSSMEKFCKEKDYNKGIFAYHYYKKRNAGKVISEHTENNPVFLPVEIIEKHQTVITVNGFHITVTDDTDVSSLKIILKAIGDISWN